MPDDRPTTVFEARFARTLTSFADAGVRPIDAVQLAHALVAAHPRRRAARPIALASLARGRLLVAAVLLAMAIAVLAAAAGAVRRAANDRLAAELLASRSGDVIVIDADRTLTDLGPGRVPTWSADHRIVAFAAANRVVAVDRSTGQRTDLGPFGPADGSFAHPYEWVETSFDGRWILLGSAILNSDRYVLIDRATGARTTLGWAAFKDIGIPDWAPADDRLVAVTHDGQLLLVDAAASPPTQRLLDDGPSIPGEVAFGPRNEVAFVSGRGIWVVGTDGHGLRPLVPAPSDPTLPLHNPAWSPDGSRAAYVMGAPGTSSIGLFDLTSGEVTRLAVESGVMVDGLEWLTDDRLRLVLDTPPASPDGVPSSRVRWMTFDGTIVDTVDLGPGVDWVSP